MNNEKPQRPSTNQSPARGIPDWLLLGMLVLIALGLIAAGYFSYQSQAKYIQAGISNKFALVETLAIEALTLLLLASLAAIFFITRKRKMLQKLLKVEQELAGSQEETRTILYGIGDGVIAVNRSSQVTHLNPVAEELTGWSEREALDRPLDDVFILIDEVARQRLENPVSEVLQQGKVMSLENHTVLVSRDGRERPVADSAAPIRDDQGGITGVVLVFRDQTFERQIQKERALFDETLSASLNEIYIFDSESLYYRSANAGALKNLGLTQEQLQQLTPLEVKPEFTRHSLQRILKPLILNTKKMQIFETIHRRADGSYYPVECHLQLIDRFGERLFLEVALDISDRRKAQEDLRKSEERHRLLADNAHDVIWTTDIDNRLTYVSPSIQSLLGFAPEDFVGTVFEENLPPESAAVVQNAMRDNLLGLQLGLPFKGLRLEYEQARKDGTTIWADVSVSGMYNEDGAFIGLVGVTRDITERRRSEEKLTYRLRFEELISGISTRFINLTPGQVDDEVHQALEELGLFIEVDRAFIFTYDEEQSDFRINYEWCRPEVKHHAAELQNMSLADHPAWVRALTGNQAIILDGPERIAEFHGSDTDNPLPGLNSIAVFPLWMDQKLYGCVGFESASPGRRWGEDTILLLQQFSNILSSSYERARLTREIEKRAVRDELTGAYNRRGLIEIGEIELHRARRYQHSLGMIFFDVDHFKQINDSLGHVAGDLVLREVARRCGEIIRDVDIFCRWGGDEFMVLLPESDLDFSCQVGKRLHERISTRPFFIDEKEIPISISVGISGALDPNVSLEEMLHNADKSLYTAKTAGRNRVHCGKFA